MDRNAFLAAQLAKPITHHVVTTYDDGRAVTHEVRSSGAAENYAIGQRRKIGRPLINRETGKTVCVISVDIRPL